jgi:hypothetical protein
MGSKDRRPSYAVCGGARAKRFARVDDVISRQELDAIAHSFAIAAGSMSKWSTAGPRIKGSMGAMPRPVWKIFSDQRQVVASRARHHGEARETWAYQRMTARKATSVRLKAFSADR